MVNVPRDWLDYEAEHGFIRARMQLLATEERGRKGPIFTDYRASWDIGNTYEGEWTINDAPVTLEDVEQLAPGEEATVRLHPIAREFWNQVKPGMTIYAHEGRRRVATAVVMEWVSLDGRP